MGFYLKGNYFAEKVSAKKLVQMLCNDKKDISIRVSDIEKSICKHEKLEGIALAEMQKQAVRYALTKKVSIVTGGPGRGKTTVLNMILKVYREFYPKNRILLMAPTGRAARRMSETTNHAACTMHSALGLRSDSDLDCYNSDLKLDADMVIVDEMSMVDQRIFSILCSQLTDDCTIVFVGDKDQLPSIGAGNVFAELIQSGIIPATVLDTPFRQNENDLIFINAERINNGNPNLIEGNTFKIIDASGETDIRDKCIDIYKYYLKRNHNDLDSIFLLSPFRKRTEIGSDRLNEALQKNINVNAGKSAVKAAGKRFCKGDKVMQMKNITTEDNLSLSNGDIGYVSELKYGMENDSSVTVKYEGVGRKEYSGHDDMEMLELAYATTVHKAQGSEALTVIIPMSNLFSVMLKKSIIYTAVSRAKGNVVIVGDRSALGKAILNNKTEQRNTLLRWQIQCEYQKHMREKRKQEEFRQLSFIG